MELLSPPPPCVTSTRSCHFPFPFLISLSTALWIAKIERSVDLLYSPLCVSPTPGPVTFTFNFLSFTPEICQKHLVVFHWLSQKCSLKRYYFVINCLDILRVQSYGCRDCNLFPFLSFLFDCLSFILWKGWNWQDWCWSHWTKHKGNCPIFHFLNKTKNMQFYHFTTKSLLVDIARHKQNIWEGIQMF